ncbi:peptide-methionine (S)-S-oxide reductase MsrA [Flavobacterium sp. 7A]|uniref:peptide-methionine (S)-S-oxide reductase MsrA n=1 Tax=Flavobacterium sp. 7A TaxID=2940571 RepID=UPI002226C14C|nr:peptide-methionine (S)-S-oxide reductase MsrA [Flavobacterium sp. 7A]MCW2119833.1 peptide-methionine (S)-S-oxide reductase [Flavobacterium sp. 7A]
MSENIKNEIAIFGGGCFWCTEAVFLQLKGVQTAIPGYIGGLNPNPTYKEVCTGETGHAEAIQIEFNPDEITYDKLLEIFFATHDPTTLNRQGNDIGTQYRSEIFYKNEDQRKIAEAYIDFLTAEKIHDNKIITKISEATTFYQAEDYHHNYYNGNKEQGYCNMVITPKVNKFEKIYADLLKK